MKSKHHLFFLLLVCCAIWIWMSLGIFSLKIRGIPTIAGSRGLNHNDKSKSNYQERTTRVDIDQIVNTKLHREIKHAHSETVSNIATQVRLCNAHNLTEIRQQCERKTMVVIKLVSFKNFTSLMPLMREDVKVVYRA